MKQLIHQYYTCHPSSFERKDGECITEFIADNTHNTMDIDLWIMCMNATAEHFIFASTGAFVD